MHACPQRIGEDQVVCYTPVDSRHRYTGATRHFLAGVLAGPARGLAICKSPGTPGLLLYGCDAQWSVLTDTWHSSLAEALAQAEHEYAGSLETWVYYGHESAKA
jgi:hypothetical protein